MAQEQDLQPNMEWCIATSLARNVLPRCPFATVDKCPRYYQSVLVVGMSGRSTVLDSEDNSRLFEKWKKTDVWPAIEEDVTSSWGGGTGIYAFRAMCPEVSFERFGWFASQLIGYRDEVERDSAWKGLTSELAAKNNVDADLININDPPDWRWEWKTLAPRHYTECPLYSPLTMGVQEIVGERQHPVGFGVAHQAQSEETEQAERSR